MQDKDNPQHIVDEVLKRISDGSIYREQRRIKFMRVLAILALVLIVVIAILDAPAPKIPHESENRPVRSSN